jgi:hypothetical protein
MIKHQGRVEVELTMSKEEWTEFKQRARLEYRSAASQIVYLIHKFLEGDKKDAT